MDTARPGRSALWPLYRPLPRGRTRTSSAGGRKRPKRPPTRQTGSIAGHGLRAWSAVERFHHLVAPQVFDTIPVCVTFQPSSGKRRLDNEHRRRGARVSGARSAHVHAGQHLVPRQGCRTLLGSHAARQPNVPAPMTAIRSPIFAAASHKPLTAVSRLAASTARPAGTVSGST